MEVPYREAGDEQRAAAQCKLQTAALPARPHVECPLAPFGRRFDSSVVCISQANEMKRVL